MKTPLFRAHLKDLINQTKDSLSQLAPVKKTHLEEAFARGLGKQSFASLMAANNSGNEFPLEDFSISEAVSRYGALSKNPYDAELLRSILLRFNLVVGIVKRPLAAQGWHKYTDTAYDCRVRVPDTLAGDVAPELFMLPENFGAFGMVVASRASHKADGDFAITRNRSGHNLLSAEFIDHEWLGALYLLAEQAANDQRYLRSASIALARSAIVSASPWVRCLIYRPDRYDEGAWRIDMSLGPAFYSAVSSLDISFRIPQLPERRFDVRPPYLWNLDPAKGVHDGRFVNGQWRCHMYSNGVPEASNVTPVHEVYRQLIESVSAVSLS